MDTMHELCTLVSNRDNTDYCQDLPDQQIQVVGGPNGCPKLDISPEYLKHLLEIPLSVTTIARLLGVSRHTIHRRMSENNISVSAMYTNMTDDELDAIVAADNATLRVQNDQRCP